MKMRRERKSGCQRGKVLTVTANPTTRTNSYQNRLGPAESARGSGRPWINDPWPRFTVARTVLEGGIVVVAARDPTDDRATHIDGSLGHFRTVARTVFGDDIRDIRKRRVRRLMRRTGL